MSRTRPLIATAAVTLAVGWTLGTLGSGNLASAQDKPHVGPRYQLEAYGYGQDGGQVPGAYVLDVDTGDLFWARGSNKMVRAGSVREAR